MNGIRFLIGIDGGGTGCRVRVRDLGGSLLGEGAGGPGNIRLGLDVAWSNIFAALDLALAEAGLDRTVLAQASIGLGLAGIVDLDTAEAAIAAGPACGAVRAVSDAHIACLGAFGGGDGAILISGTGSAGHAVIDGVGVPMFGWGFEVDDKGSAASLGRSAITAALDGRDGLARETGFTRDVLDVLGTTTPAIVRWVSSARPRQFGEIAPLAFAHAHRGDPVALSLVRRSAGDVEAMIARLIEIGADRVCLVGGMAEHIAPWLTPWARGLLAVRQEDATEGAILLAQQAVTERTG
ncbi:BadF/BadG/BcrA/BcrD ATPase family protein [Sphingomonas sp. Tas61C01]|uniref:BadF/BadG/BcrA/BcrD ATPase family protein n=1 Tax=Sphingomonas sp. Tas61C01 TaxID=3458297 RepID=UPI00403EA28F